MTKIFNFALKIKRGGREGGTCEVLRPCYPPKKKIETCTLGEFRDVKKHCISYPSKSLTFLACVPDHNSKRKESGLCNGAKFLVQASGCINL